MKLEDIKKEMPKTPEMIHNRIQDEIKKQMENEQIAVFPTQNAKKTKWSRTRVAAVAAVCILGVSTSAYAGSKWYAMHLEKQGTYQVATKISANEQSKMTAIQDEIPNVKKQSGNLPDGIAE